MTEGERAPRWRFDALFESYSADGIVREISVTWGTSASAWTYTVTYSGLGETAAPVAPTNARPLRERLRAERTG
jgi:hypothetical protein